MYMRGKITEQTTVSQIKDRQARIEIHNMQKQKPS